MERCNPQVRQNDITHIVLNVTETCNLGCPYCFANQKGQKLRTMKWEVLKDCIDWLIRRSGDSKHISITWFGGEPTVVWDLVKKGTLYAEEEAQKCGKKVSFSMTTNGYALPDDFEAFVFAPGRKFSVLLSFDGIPEAQNLNRPTKSGGETFTNVEKALDRLLKIEAWRKSGTQIRLTFNKATVKYLYDSLVWFFEEKGVHSIASMPVEEEKWTEEELEEARKIFTKIGEYYIDRYRQGKPIYLKIFHDVLERQIIPAKPKRSLVKCGFAINQVAIDPEGNISSCHRMLDYDRGVGDYHMGTIYDEDISKINKIREKFGETKIEDIRCEMPERCVYCPIKPSCGGGCVAVNVEACGDPRIVPKTACDLRIIWFEVACKIDAILGAKGERNKFYMQRFYRPDRQQQPDFQEFRQAMLNLHRKVDKLTELICSFGKAFLAYAEDQEEVTKDDHN